MVAMMGLIVEDESDFDVLSILIRKITNKRFILKKHIGHGCGRIRNKCRVWAQDFERRGVKYMIVVHDLDDRPSSDGLKNDIEAILRPSPIARHEIIIPVREIEAWLLADETAIKQSLNLKKKIKKVTNPESIRDPKGHLGNIVRASSKDNPLQYVNTIHNKRIAEHISISALRRCDSFVPFENFISQC